jgi:hypothetical protein
VWNGGELAHGCVSSTGCPNPEPHLHPNPEPRNLKHEFETRDPNPRPEPRDSRPEIPNLKPQTPDPRPQTQNPKPETPNPEPQTPNPKLQPQTPNLRPQTPNPKEQSIAGSVCVPVSSRTPTQGPSWGYFKVNCSETLSFFDDKCLQNGSNNEPRAPRTNLECPYKGPRVERVECT